MMPSPIDELTMQRLSDRAQEETCTVAELLNSWLESAPTSVQPVTPETVQMPVAIDLHTLQMAQLIENRSLAVAMFAPDMRDGQANRGWRDQYRLGQIDLIGRSHYEVFPEIGEEWKAIHRRCLEGAVDTNPCAAFIREDGFLDWIRWEVRPWYLDAEQTRIGGLIMYTEVITERVETERSLRASELRHRALFEQSNDAIFVISTAGTFLDANHRALDMLGYTLEELHSLNYLAVIAPAQRPASAATFQRLLGGESMPSYHRTLLRKDGSTFVANLKGGPIYDEHSRVLYIQHIVRDVTEEILHEQQVRIKDKAIAASITPIALADLAGQLTYVNQAFLKLWKYDSEEQVIGRSVLDFWEDPQAAQVVVDALLTEGHFVGELRARRIDGQMCDVALTASMVHDAQGHPICMMGSFNDVTRQKQAEAFALENERLKVRFQKEHAQNTLIQQMISMLSHDLRSQLAVIASSRDMLDHYFDRLSEEGRRDRLETIGRQVKYALQMLDDTVQMARGNLNEREFDPGSVNLAMLCQVSLDEIRLAQQGHHTLHFINRGGIEIAYIDEVLVSRILLNLLSNALKYSPGGGEIRLELDSQEGWIVLEVIDQGMGISDHDLPYIFDPFYRAQTASGISGTGLGLSIVKDCVTRHGGQIVVESAPGQGCTFRVLLPAQ